MEYTTENTYLQIVRMKDDNENGGLGAALKRSLAPSQFYVIEKTPEIASSFYRYKECQRISFGTNNIASRVVG